MAVLEDLDDDFDSGICRDDDPQSSGSPPVATEDTVTLRDLYWSPGPERRRSATESMTMDETGDVLVFCPFRQDWIKVSRETNF